MRHDSLLALVVAALAASPVLLSGPAVETSATVTAALADAAVVGVDTTALPDPDAPPGPGGCPLVTLAKGEHSGWGFDRPGFLGADLIIAEPAAWGAFWARHAGEPDQPPPPPPPVDFGRKVVIVTVQGPQSSGGGPNTAVLDVHRDGPFVRVVVFDDERPGPLDVITNPFHIVLAERCCLAPHAAAVFEHVAPQLESAVVAGRVLTAEPGAEPRPLPGAHVMLAGPEGVEPRHAMSGLDGTFSLVNVPPGPYELHAEAPGFEPVVMPVEAPPNARVFRALVLPPLPVEPGLIVGHVARPTPDGPHPLPGSVLTLLREGEVLAETFTGDDGAYEFPNVLPGAYELRAEHEGFFPQMVEVHVGPGQVVMQDFVLEPRPPEFGVFAGAVLGACPDGAQVPIAGACVRLMRPDGFFRTIRTGPEGQFVMPDLPAGEYQGTARAPGWRPASVPIAVQPGAVTEHVFVLQPAPRTAEMP